MAASMLGAGRLANVMARADACMPLGTSMRVSGKKMCGMGREAASMLQGTSTKARMLLCFHTLVQALCVSAVQQGRSMCSVKLVFL